MAVDNYRETAPAVDNWLPHHHHASHQQLICLEATEPIVALQLCERAKRGNLRCKYCRKHSSSSGIELFKTS